MNPTRSNATSGAAWILGAASLALAATAALMLAGVGPDRIRAVWLVAAVWMVAASFVQALLSGLRHGDWTAFRCESLPPDDENLDFETKTGRYAYKRIQAHHEALMREGERDLHVQDRLNSL
ncbi:MAG: hypothetical protein OXQ89_05555 [Rhodospirillaceae bacterium]|nr:hypothetical protein [Rhodospirillaceae bacterium]MDD9997192.1 hypothetical protein [Rhodospirillaceae bacterium]MDE0361921.1 hypothetical protein [Rhodospirillaceae bacterium]